MQEVRSSCRNTVEVTPRLNPTFPIYPKFVRTETPILSCHCSCDCCQPFVAGAGDTNYKHILACYLKKNDLPIQYETTSIGRSTNPAKFVSSIEIKGNIFGSMCECCLLGATVFRSADLCKASSRIVNIIKSVHRVLFL